MKASTTSVKTAKSNPNPLAIISRDPFDRNDRGSCRQLNAEEEHLLALVRKALAAADVVMEQHGPTCEYSGCEFCRHVAGVRYVLEVSIPLMEGC